MSRKVSLLLTCIVVLIGLMGIFPVQAQDMTEVKMVYWTGPESLAMANVIDQYNRGQGQEDGVQVQMVLFGREGFWERQETIMAAESPEVDIFYTASYYVGRQEAALEPLQDYVDNMGEDSIFIPSTLESLTYNDTLYGVPLDVSLHFLYYRTDLIDQLLSDEAWQQRYREISAEQMGMEMEPKPVEEWVWEDYYAASLFFTKALNPDSPTEYGTVLQAKNLVYNIMIWNNVLWSKGGNWFAEDGSFAFDTPEFREAAQVYADILNSGATPAASTTYEYGEANQAFMTGQAAFYMQWSAAFNEINGPNSMTSGNVGIAPIPGPNPSTHVHSLGVALSKYSENKEAAAKWLSYLATEEAMQLYAESGGLPPVSAVLTSMAETRPEFPQTAEHLELYGYVESTSAETFAILDVLARNLSSYWAGQIDLDTAAVTAQEEASALME
jgi:multiple sugar transport system substrate-binding protein